VLETIDLNDISSLGYAFQIETTYRTLRTGFRVVEVPITFVDREVGGSKMSKWIVLEAIWRVPALRARALLGRL
jgi:dolichol-phosphate mannosyltransferase